MKYLLLILALACGPSWADGVPLFDDKQVPESAMSSAERFNFQELQRRKEFSRVVMFDRANLGALDATVITLTVEGKAYRFVATERKTDDKNRITTWTGSDGSSWLTLTREDRMVIGTASLGTRNYRVIQRGSRMALAELAPPRQQADDVVREPGPPKEMPPHLKTDRPKAKGQVRLQDPAPPVIRVLHVYVNNGAAAYGFGMSATAVSADLVGIMNGALARSGMSTRIESAGTLDWNTGHPAYGNGLGVEGIYNRAMNDVSLTNQRDTLNADIVVVINGAEVPGDPYLGKSTIYPQISRMPVAVVDAATAGSTYLHEMAHQFGVEHQTDSNGLAHPLATRQRRIGQAPICFRTIGSIPTNPSQSWPGISWWRTAATPNNDSATAGESCQKFATQTAGPGFTGTPQNFSGTQASCRVVQNSTGLQVNFQGMDNMTEAAGPISCTEYEIAYFSNSSVLWNGVPTGGVGAESAAVIDANASLIAAQRNKKWLPPFIAKLMNPLRFFLD